MSFLRVHGLIKHNIPFSAGESKKKLPPGGPGARRPAAGKNRPPAAALGDFLEKSAENVKKPVDKPADIRYITVNRNVNKP